MEQLYDSIFNSNSTSGLFKTLESVSLLLEAKDENHPEIVLRSGSELSRVLPSSRNDGENASLIGVLCKMMMVIIDGGFHTSRPETFVFP